MIQATRKSERILVLGYDQRYIAETLRVVDCLEALATSETFLSADTARLSMPQTRRASHD